MSEVLRVAICTRAIGFGDGVGGMERAAADHALGLIEHGLDVHLFTPACDDNVPPVMKVTIVPWPRWSATRGPLFSLAYAAWVRRARRALKRSTFDVAHFHGAAVGVLRNRDLDVLAAPAVANPHGMEEFGDSSLLRRLGRLPTRLLSRRAQNASRVIATDQILVESTVRNLAVDPSRVLVVPNAVDRERLAALVRPHTESGYQIVSVGRVVPNKGYDLLLEALKDPQVRSVLPDGWAWVHYGAGGGAESLLQAAASEPSVPLTLRSGRSDQEVQSAVANSALFVQPSRYEGSSLTTLEAMSHGCLVVGTAVGGIPDKVEDGVTGFLAPEATSEDIAAAIVRAITCDDVAVRQAAAARVRERFSIESALGAYIRMYEELAHGDA
jgi:glycosyltransferase involved in cell wall biosynthesis